MPTYNKVFSKINFLNILISLYPIVAVIGNLAINLNTLFIIILGIYTFKGDVFNFKNKIINYLCLSFFLFLIATSLYNYLPLYGTKDIYEDNIIKSFLYLRYFLLFLVINKLAEENLINLKYLFFTGAISASVVGFDIVIQSLLGKNILGMPQYDSLRLSGLFGDEAIAGGYLQKFSLFLIFLFPFLNINKIRKNFTFYFIITLIFSFTCIVLTNNRMPLILFCLSFLFFGIIEKRIRKLMLISTIILSIVFTFMYSFNKKTNIFFNSFFGHSIEIVTKSYNLFTNKDNTEVRSKHLKTFNAAINLWKDKKILGSGIKSFRVNCVFDQKNNNLHCNAHQHNYFIEILLDTGIIGLFILYLFFLIVIVRFFIQYMKIEGKNFYERIIFMPPALILFVEIMPIKSSGSFFTTNIATIIFLLLPLLINFKRIKLTNI